MKALIVGVGLAMVINCSSLTGPLYANEGYSSTGIASWYGGGEKLNEYTASGRKFNPNELGCAMWSVPFGTRMLVTNLDNGKRVHCTVWDRGPARRLGRLIDLYRAAFEELGDLDMGLINVSVVPSDAA